MIPGGLSRAGVAYSPHPIVVERGQGARIIDLDGNEYVDFVNHHTALVHGHAHPNIAKAIQRQAEHGTGWSALSLQETELAETLSQRVRSVKRIRFSNSGTEAAMQAARIVRAWSGKPKILKFEGGMHGAFEDFEVSKRFDPERAGPPDDPQPAPGTGGFGPGTVERVLVAPFNDTDAVARRLRDHADEIAAVFVEPLMSFAGEIPPEDGFLPFLWEISRRHRLLLVADEVVSFRLAPGGAQELYGIQPDLTIFGKLIGGGLPVGAVGGREDIMALSAFRWPGEDGQRLALSGTFSGSAMVMAAGQAALELLDQSAIDHINALGEKMRAGFRAVFKADGVQAQVTGAGSLLNVHFTPRPVANFRAAATSDFGLMAQLHLALLNRGIYASPYGSFNVSTAMGVEDVDAGIVALKEALNEVGV